MASSGIKRDIPIKLDRDFSVLDTEFSNIRERFEAEMKKMEDEMTRFRSELTNHESSFFKSVSRQMAMFIDRNLYPPDHKTVIKFRRHHTSSSEHSTSTTSKTEGWDPAAPPKRSTFDSFKSTEGNAPMNAQQDSAWLDGLNSPLIMDEGDRKMLKLRFDVSQYAPEEIVVKSVDNKLLVSTLHVPLGKSLPEVYSGVGSKLPEKQVCGGVGTTMWRLIGLERQLA
ncbi:hypothetical protein WN48_04040 [Eufriesea mexicana]|uniref:Heat shock protein beta-1 n=1 Tax=Eufriesea mexicana TaxID=516756 RepID=A0A310SMQ3_9HYME|nr:hypothetical protein WN48_04040 [Eufriesea mexicana]